MTKKIILLTLITLAISSALFLKLGFSKGWFVSYLSFNRPLKAELLVVEGWVSGSTIQLAAQEFQDKTYAQILCSGSPTDPYYILSENGLLEFSFKNQPLRLEGNDSLSFLLKGSPVQGIYPEYLITVNEQILFKGMVNSQEELYSLVLDTSILALTVNIHFLNDTHFMGEDRNLEVKSLCINGTEYPARSVRVNQYGQHDHQKLKPRSTNFASVAEICASELRKEGIPGHLIKVVPSPVSNRNRTLASAIIISDYLDSQDLPYSRLNIISEGIHARRTWLAYKFAFRKQNRELGIISIPQSGNNNQQASHDNKEILKELTSIVYYKLFFNKSKYKKQLIRQSPSDQKPS